MSDPSAPVPQNVPDAGWYPDPAGGGGTRWWDGKGWTDHVRPDLSGPSAPSSSLPATSATSTPASSAPTDEVPWWAASGSGTAPSWWQDAGPGGSTGGSAWNADPSAPWTSNPGGPGGGYAPADPYAMPRQIGRPPNAPGATKAMWLGIVSLLCCSLLGPWAIYTGVQVRFRIRVSNGRLGGEGYAIAGIILGALSTLLFCYSLYRTATGHPLWTVTTTGRR